MRITKLVILLIVAFHSFLDSQDYNVEFEKIDLENTTKFSDLINLERIFAFNYYSTNQSELSIKYLKKLRSKNRNLFKEVLNDAEFKVLNSIEYKVRNKTIRDFPLSAYKENENNFIIVNADFISNYNRFLHSNALKVSNENYGYYDYLFYQISKINGELNPYNEFHIPQEIKSKNDIIHSISYLSMLRFNFYTFYLFHELYHLCYQKENESEIANELNADKFAYDKIQDIYEILYQSTEFEKFNSNPYLAEINNSNPAAISVYMAGIVNDYISVKLLSDPLKNKKALNDNFARQEMLVKRILSELDPSSFLLSFKLNSQLNSITEGKNMVTTYSAIIKSHLESPSTEKKDVLNSFKENNWTPTTIANYYLDNGDIQKAYDILIPFAEDRIWLPSEFGDNMELEVIMYTVWYSQIICAKIHEHFFEDHEGAIKLAQLSIEKDNKLLPKTYFIEYIKHLNTPDNNK